MFTANFDFMNPFAFGTVTWDIPVKWRIYLKGVYGGSWLATVRFVLVCLDVLIPACYLSKNKKKFY